MGVGGNNFSSTFCSFIYAAMLQGKGPMDWSMPTRTGLQIGVRTQAMQARVSVISEDCLRTSCIPVPSGLGRRPRYYNGRLLTHK